MSSGRRLFLGWVLAGLFLVLLVRSGFHPTTIDSRISVDKAASFSWAEIVPSDELEWSDCYSGHQCARLNVPLNHSEPDGEKAVIALTRYPAAVPADSPLYRGPILFNPGGPGGSGVDFIALAGSGLAEIVGPEFDIVGFDPRGVAHSTPRVSFFDTDVERQLWGHPALTELNASSDALGRFWARAQLYNRLAAQRANFIQHINTDQTAKDMLQIVKAHGREKLQYWGISYGSVLGAVFAALFPDKVERIVIDGVVDAENYFDSTAMVADKAMQTFFDSCVAAGPDGCAFYAPTPEAISQNLTDLFELVQTHPIPVSAPSGDILVDYNLLRLTVFTALYWPQTLWAPVAEALATLAALARGEGSPLSNTSAFASVFEGPCDPADHQFDVVADAQVVVICNDGRVVPSGFDEAATHYQKMGKTSSWGSLLASIRIMCSFPILVIGNTADPITSLWAWMSKAFPGSVVLTQDCPGHTSLAAPSTCTRGYLRAYFYNGTLPGKDTVCPVLGSPFPEQPPLKEEQTVFSSTQEQTVVSVTRRLSAALRAAQPRTAAARFVL
ncbi:alpha/beta hydrolase fold-domain-containing protein [Mycena polygramma]|nr:alpha/beta hydrolase fold-domain-containing protein [Mycena polygramma]